MILAEMEGGGCESWVLKVSVRRWNGYGRVDCSRIKTKSTMSIPIIHALNRNKSHQCLILISPLPSPGIHKRYLR